VCEGVEDAVGTKVFVAVAATVLVGRGEAVEVATLVAVAEFVAVAVGTLL
jgi:hypothetical protein